MSTVCAACSASVHRIVRLIRSRRRKIAITKTKTQREKTSINSLRMRSNVLCSGRWLWLHVMPWDFFPFGLMFVFSSFGKLVISVFLLFVSIICFGLFFIRALCRSWYKKLLRGFSLYFWGYFFGCLFQEKLLPQKRRKKHRVKSINKFRVTNSNWTDMKSFWACFSQAKRLHDVWQAEMEMSVWSTRAAQLLKVYVKDMPCSLFNISISMGTQLNVSEWQCPATMSHSTKKFHIMLPFGLSTIWHCIQKGICNKRKSTTFSWN